jgi:ubiquinone/menaquinone biosynthesis C-methylase UbiE
METKKLNIGCGKKIMTGFVNLDVCKIQGVDVVHNLDKFPYPFKDNNFEYIHAEQVLEHLNDLPRSMKELHRISKPGAIIDIGVPYFRSESAFVDPTHKIFFTYHTMDHFTNKLKQDVPLKTHLFDYVKREFIFRKTYRVIGVSIIAKKFPHFYETMLSHIFPAGGMRIVLRARK